MNSVVFYCVISAVIWSVIAIRCIKKTDDIFNYVTVFILFYLLNYQIKMIATKNGIYLLNSNQFGDDMQMLAMVLSDFSALLIVFPMFLEKRKINYNTEVANRLGYRNWFYTICVMFVISIGLCILAYGISSLTDITSIEAMVNRRTWRALNRHGSGGKETLRSIATLLELSIVYFTVIGWKQMKRMQKIISLGMIGFLAWYFFSIYLAKTDLLLPLMGFAIIYNAVTKQKCGRGIPITWAFRILVLVIILIPILDLIDVASSSKDGFLAFATLRNFFVPSFDCPDNLTAILSRMNNVFLGDGNFTPLIYNLFASKIPRAIWPSKNPLGSKVMIVKDYLPEFYEGGASTTASPSIVGDAIVSMGLISVAILSIVYGIIFYHLYKKMRYEGDYFYTIIYASLCTSMNSFCRSGSGIIGDLLFKMILIITTYLICVFITQGRYRLLSRINLTFGNIQGK